MQCSIQKENEELKEANKEYEKANKILQDKIFQLMHNFGKEKRMSERVRDNEVFIVGAGTSLKGFHFHQLADKDTIAVNVAAFDVPNPTYCITGDSGMFRKVQEGYFKGIETTWVMILQPWHSVMKREGGKLIHNRSGFVYDVFCMDILIKSSGLEGIGFSFNDFRTGYNSGFCALQLAVLLGYKKIYLLGIDLCKGLQKTHYHDRYGKNKKIPDGELDKFYKNFVLALDIIKKETDIEVISCSSISRLNEYIPYQPFNRGL